MNKISKRDIKSASVLSRSPLVVNVIHTDGSSNAYTLRQLQREMTPGAQQQVRSLIEPARLTT